jgi:hypothetical protein
MVVSSERLMQGSFALSTSAPVHVWRFSALVAAMQLLAWTPLPFSTMEVRDLFPYSFVKGGGGGWLFRSSVAWLLGRRQQISFPLLSLTSQRRWSFIDYNASRGCRALAIAASSKLDASCEEWRWILACFEPTSPGTTRCKMPPEINQLAVTSIRATQIKGRSSWRSMHGQIPFTCTPLPVISYSPINTTTMRQLRRTVNCYLWWWHDKRPI